MKYLVLAILNSKCDKNIQQYKLSLKKFVIYKRTIKDRIFWWKFRVCNTHSRSKWRGGNWTRCRKRLIRPSKRKCIFKADCRQRETNHIPGQSSNTSYWPTAAELLTGRAVKCYMKRACGGKHRDSWILFLFQAEVHWNWSGRWSLEREGPVSSIGPTWKWPWSDFRMECAWSVILILITVVLNR